MASLKNSNWRVLLAASCFGATLLAACGGGGADNSSAALAAAAGTSATAAATVADTYSQGPISGGNKVTTIAPTRAKGAQVRSAA